VRKQIIYLASVSLLFATGAFGQSVAAPGASTQVVAIKAGRLIDVEGGKELSNQVILIRGNRIDAVGAQLNIPADAKVIDLSGMTVLPGLIDCHTHLADGARDGGDPLTYLKKTAA